MLFCYFYHTGNFQVIFLWKSRFECLEIKSNFKTTSTFKQWGRPHFITHFDFLELDIDAYKKIVYTESVYHTIAHRQPLKVIIINYLDSSVI